MEESARGKNSDEEEEDSRLLLLLLLLISPIKEIFGVVKTQNFDVLLTSSQKKNLLKSDAA